MAKVTLTVETSTKKIAGSLADLAKRAMDTLRKHPDAHVALQQGIAMFAASFGASQGSRWTRADWEAFVDAQRERQAEDSDEPSAGGASPEGDPGAGRADVHSDA